MEIRFQRFEAHDGSRLSYVRRVEATVVEDGRFEYRGSPLSQPAQWAAAVQKIKREARENAVVLYLDRGYVPVGYDLWLGGLDFVNIDPRRVFLIGSQILASKMVIAHNHPILSDCAMEPSGPDAAFCMQMSSLGRMMDLVLEDFIIIHPQGYVSFLASNHPALVQVQPRPNSI